MIYIIVTIRILNGELLNKTVDKEIWNDGQIIIFKKIIHIYEKLENFVITQKSCINILYHGNL